MPSQAMDQDNQKEIKPSVSYKFEYQELRKCNTKGLSGVTTFLFKSMLTSIFSNFRN